MSSIQKEIQLIPTGIIWELIVVATQPVGAPDPMGMSISIPEGERALLLGGQIGQDNYGAGRVVTATLRHQPTATVLYTLGTDTVDNQVVTIPPILVSITETATTLAIIGVPYMPFLMPESAGIRVLANSVASTETLTARLWIATRVLPPTVAAAGAGVTLTTNTALQV